MQQRNPSRFDLRTFAVLQAPLVLYFGSGLVQQGLPSAVAWGAGIASLTATVIGLFFPQAILGYYQTWMACVTPVGWVITQFLVAMIFFGVVTPIGLSRRACSRDPLQRSSDPLKDSYWERRSNPRDEERYFRPF